MKNNKCIYTFIIGDYDNLKHPRIITPDWDYICVTDNPNLKSDVWQIKYIQNKKLSNVLAARCIKIRFFDYIKDDLVIAIGDELVGVFWVEQDVILWKK